MHQSEVEIRVRYSETDKMGYCYYGNYAQYLEVGRVEGLRGIGLSYKDLEDRGIGLPVSHYSIEYKRPAHYDDVLKVTTRLLSSEGARLFFEYEVHGPQQKLICTAKTTLVFVDLKTGRPIKVPADVQAILG
jgi:acyl-CoA thioester hydrolase